MRFDPKGIVRDETTQEFHTQWTLFTQEENGYLSGGKVLTISAMQQMTVDMYTGYDTNYHDAPDVVSGSMPSQMELEAVFRARSRALAVMIQRGRIKI